MLKLCLYETDLKVVSRTENFSLSIQSVKKFSCLFVHKLKLYFLSFSPGRVLFQLLMLVLDGLVQKFVNKSFGSTVTFSLRHHEVDILFSTDI